MFIKQFKKKPNFLRAKIKEQTIKDRVEQQVTKAKQFRQSYVCRSIPSLPLSHFKIFQITFKQLNDSVKYCGSNIEEQIIPAHL